MNGTINNFHIRETQYSIPLVNVIIHFPKRNELWVIVKESFSHPEFLLASDDLSDIVFFGYREQCDRQWLHFPGKIVKLLV